MTDRLKGFTVVLDADYRTDDVEQIKQALLMVKGVLNVQPILATPDDWMNRTRVKHELQEKLLAVLAPE